MKKRMLALLLAATTALLAVSGCGKAEEDSVATGDLSGSEDAVDVNVGLIMGPPSMGLGYFMNEAKEKKTYNNFNFEVVGVDYSAVAASLNQGDYDIATVPSNVAAILYNNKDMKEEIKVIDIGNLGLLYILTTDPDISKLEDLKGRTVYSIGEGGPPEYTFDYLLEQAGLSDDVNFSFRPTPFEVLNLLQEEDDAIALLPQPFVEVAKLLVPNLRVAIDVTKAWEEEVDGTAESVTTVTVVRKKFLEKHEQAVVEFLNMAKKSTEYCLENVDEAAEWTDEFETFLNPEIAKKAIPECNICTVTGKEMKEILSGFLQIIYDLNPDAVGGSMPDDDFYYIPPSGVDKVAP